jgi:dipeptidyl aminopeptidase/acylaminoacyl peptidase
MDVCVVANVDGPLGTLDRIGDGAGKTFITDFDTVNRNDGVGFFSWDPQTGNRIAFVRDSTDGVNPASSRIYTALFDGTDVQPLSPDFMDLGSGPLRIEGPIDWSPDGTQLVFSAVDAKGIDHIYRIDRNGTGLTQLTSGPDADDDPLFSPNGQEILFTRNLAAAGFCSLDAYIMNADGSNSRQITNEQVCDVDTSVLGYDWSPDGSEIVLTGFNMPFGSVLIYVIKRTTTAATYFAERRLVGRGAVDFEVQDVLPSWRP